MKDFDLNNTNIDEKSCSYLLPWICNDQDSKYVEINSVKVLYLVFSKTNGNFNKNKYLMLVNIDESKKEKKE